MAFPERPCTIITGAGSGLGRALALHLAQRKARLVLSDLNEATLEETAKMVIAAGAEAHTVAGDISRIETVQRLRTVAAEHFGEVDILINNAGFAVFGEIAEVPPEDWRRQIDVNLHGVVLGCHAFMPGMVRRGRGFILNVASSAGLMSLPGLGAYNASKAAVVALSRTMRAELAGTGVKVSALCPTIFKSNIHRTAKTFSEPLDDLAEGLITTSRWPADKVAAMALRGLERGQLHVIPQLDGRIFWVLHRLWPAGLHAFFGLLYRKGWLERLGRWSAGRTVTRSGRGQ